MDFSGQTPFDFRSWLQCELVRRKKKNPSFSLRSFSRKIGVSPSTLSQLLSGDRRLTSRTACKLAESLNPDEVTKEKLLRASEHVQEHSSKQNLRRANDDVVRTLSEMILSDECQGVVEQKLKALLHRVKTLTTPEGKANGNSQG